MFSVYALCDPRTHDLRYVGKTCRSLNERLADHMTPSYLKTSTYKNRWLRQLKSAGLKPDIVLLETHVSEDALNEAERFFHRALSVSRRAPYEFNRRR